MQLAYTTKYKQITTIWTLSNLIRTNFTLQRQLK